jgi:hypothetical protein
MTKRHSLAQARGTALRHCACRPSDHFGAVVDFEIGIGTPGDSRESS